ncbi:MAG: polysaccharide biosynthesis tyrosine autokinase, partial [Planctomycetes bacterium]|nr:polysaccharide biosynthesis tyrosine autokinase [Planctomycetota bacterium]
MIRFVRAVRERKIIPILCVGVFCLAGIIYYVVTPEVYEARSDVLLKGRNNRDVRLLTSEPVLSNVVQELADEKIPELETLPKSEWVPYIRNHLSVKSPGGRPDILNLRYASRDPQAATAILNRLVTVYVSYLNHKLYETFEMDNYRARLHRLLSKDVSILLGDTPQTGVQTTNRENARSEKSRDVQNNPTFVEFPPDRMTPGVNSGPGLKVFKQPAEPIIQITLTLTEPQKELDDATHRLDKSANTKYLSRESTLRLGALQEVIWILEDLKNVHNIKETIILSRATVPAEPASPLKLTTILPVLVFLGFGLGLGIIYVVNAVDDRFYSPSELSRRLGLPILEIIQKKTHLGRFLTNGTPRHLSLKEVEFSEFEALRVTLDLLDEKSNVLVISSVDSKAGKTTLSAGLATAFAQSGKRTLLIDSDYQNGKLSRLFSDRDEAGLSRILSDEIPFSDAAEENVLCISDRGLEFLPRGKTNDSFTNLLTAKRFSEFLSWCETRYDQIVIDAPTALDSCDASILGEAADGIILVVTPDSTTRSRTLRACCNLKTLGCRLIGVVANQLDSHSPWLTKEGYGYVGVDSQM